jgi:hypothetical protein
MTSTFNLLDCTMPARILRRFVLTCGLLVVATSTGCSIFTTRQRESTSSLDLTSLKAAGYSFDNEGAVVQAIPESQAIDNMPTVVLDVRNGKQHLERIPMSPDKPLFVEDVVKDAKLVERIGKLKLSVVRQTTPSSPPVRMDVDFDSRGKSVMQEQNYALQPNDRVIVIKDDRTWIDRALANLSLRKRID